MESIEIYSSPLGHTLECVDMDGKLFDFAAQPATEQEDAHIAAAIYDDPDQDHATGVVKLPKEFFLWVFREQKNILRTLGMEGVAVAAILIPLML